MAEPATPAPPGAHQPLGPGGAAGRRPPDGLLAVDEDGRTLTFAEYRDAGRAGRRRPRGARRRRGRRRVVAAADLARVDGARRRARPARRGAEPDAADLPRARGRLHPRAQARPRCSWSPGEWRGFDYAAMARARARRARRVARPRHACSSSTIATCPTATRRRCAASDPRRCPATSPLRWLFYTSGTTADPKGARHTDAHDRPRRGGDASSGSR